MKKILLLIALFLSVNLVYAQVEDTPLFSGKVFMSQVGSGAGYWEVSGTFQDQSGYYDASGIQVGQIVFFTDAGVGYHLPITVVVSATDPSFTVRINNTGITGVLSVPTGEGVIYATTTNNLVPFVSGITDPNQQTLLQYSMEKVQSALDTKLSNTLPDGTVFIGNGSNIATSRTLSGDLSTTNTGTVTVDKIDNTQVLATGASNGQTLTWSTTNSRWEPATPSSGVTDLTISGTTSPLTLNSNTGTDVTITSGTGISLTGTSGNVTINNTGVITETDGSITNEGSLTVNAGTGTTSVISSNTSGSTDVTITAGTGLSTSESGNNITLTNTSPDQTVSLTGAGITNVIGTYPTFTVTSTEVDGSITNEALTIFDGTNSENLGGQTLTVAGSGGITPTYDIGTNVLTISASGLDPSITNEGALSVGSGASNTSTITSNTSGSSAVTIGVGTGMTISENTGTRTITLNVADQSEVNEGTLTMGAGGANTTTITSNTSGSGPMTFSGATNINVTENTGTSTLTIEAALPDGTIYVGNSSGIAQSRTMSGDASTTNTGVVTVDKVDNTQVLATGATNGQVMAWSTTNSRWEPTNATTGTVTSVAGTAGAGISITGSPITTSGTLTITNTGDTDDSDDITTSTVGIGDVDGNFPDLTVVGLQGSPIAAATPTTGQVLKWNGTAWTPDADATGGAGSTDLSITNRTSTTLDVASSSGIDATVPEATTSLAGLVNAADKTKLSFTTITQAVDLDAVEAASHAAATVSDNARLDFTLTGQQITADLAQNGATSGQVYKWNGTVWAPAIDNNTTYTAGSGIDVTGTVISNTGDLFNTNEGALAVSSGTSTTSVITSNTSGSTNITLNAGTGMTISENTGTNNITLTNASPDQTVSITGAGISAVTGTYPNFTVTSTEIDGLVTNEGSIAVGAGGANTSTITSNTSGSPTVTLSGATNMNVTESGNTITVEAALPDGTMYLGNSSNIAQSRSMSGDATITNTGVITVDKVDNTQVLATGATNGQVLKWSTLNSQWEPAADAGTSYTAGAGIDITGPIISNTGIITEVDGNISNEGQLSLSSGTSTTTILNSNTVGATSVTINAGTGLTISENTGTNNITLTNSAPDQTVVLTGAGINAVTGTYPSFTITGTEVDGSTTNELQTIIATSDATSHTETLSNTGGSIKLVEGSGITLTTTGTSADAIVTIASTASGTTDLTFTGSSSPLTLNSSSGTDVTLTAGTGVTLSGTSGNATITNSAPDQTVILTGAGITAITGTYPSFTVTSTEVDGNISNEGSLAVNAGTSTTSVIASNTSGSTNVTLNAGTGLSISENTGTNNITLTNSSPDQTVSITGAGISSVTGTYPNFTITSTEVDGSTTNELQTIANTSNATTHTATLSNTGGSLQLVEGSGITLTTTGTGLDGIVTIASTATGTTNLTVGGTSSPLTIESSSGSDMTVTAGTGISLSGSSTNMTINNTGIITEVDGSTTNELQTLANTSDATSHTGTLSNSGGSMKLVEGTGIGLTTTGTSLDGIVTVVNTAPDQTVSITGAGINVTTGTYPNFTVTGTEVDGSISNEGSLTVDAGTGTTSIINSNTTGSTGVTITAGTGLSISETGNVITLTNSSPDQTLILNGAGITSVTGTYPNFSITSTEVDGSTTNELQTVTNTSDATSHTVTLSNSGGSTQFVEGSGITLTTTGTSGAGVVTIASTGTLPSLANNNIWVGNASNVATAVNPSGDADISNTGVFTVDRVDNIDVQATGATDLQLMRWDNTNNKWKPTDERTQTIELTGTSNPEISLTGNDGTSGGGNTILVTGQRGLTVDNNSGVMDISLPSGTAGQFLKSNGSTWTAQNESLQSLRVNPTSGSAPYLELSNNAGSFASPSGSMQMVGVFPLDVIATGSSSIQSKISTTGAVNGDVIKYNGSSWAFAADATGSGGTNLAISGSSSPLTLTSDTGTDVTLTAGSGISLAGTSSDATITATDPSLSNEGALTVTQPFSTQILFNSNTSGSTPVTMQALSDSGIELNLASASVFRINMIKVLREETFTATASQTAFTMAYSAPAVFGTAYPLRVFRNGVELDWVSSSPSTTQYTFSGTTLTTAANTLNDVVRVNYFN